MSNNEVVADTAPGDQKELFALAAWLQTFPEFDIEIFNVNELDIDASRLTSVLETSEVTLAITTVAESICGVSIDSALAKSPMDDNTRTSTDMIWNSLLIMTSARARPIANETEDPSKTKLIVLGNLLDCAVQASDKQQRRTYIGRIMRLPKSAQKTIMAMIERRSIANKKARGHGSDSKKRLSHSPNQPRNRRSLSTTPNEATPRQPSLQQQQQQQPMGLLVMQPGAQQTSSQLQPLTPHQRLASMGCGSGMRNTVVEGFDVDADLRSPQHGTSPDLVIKSSLSKSSSSSKGRSVVFENDRSSGATPEKKRHSLPMPSPPAFLSPGTMESPQRLNKVVHSLQRKNELMQNTLNNYQKREEELKQKLEAIEVDHRQSMMKVESQSLDRIQEFERESSERIQELQNKLLSAEDEARKGASSLNELKVAKEELEVMDHSKAALQETMEKLRKYKDKVTELQDVKEALRNEQDAHGQSVDEIVRLENEVQVLAPIKRQVEDYKIRAIEAEVKLVECQDCLRRIEQHADDQSAANEHLYKGAIMQKDQIEEMQRRIQLDTQRSLDEDVTGVGDGISELNPKLKEELVRLRNENLQLRAFQAKRTEDAVEHLESSLGDAKQLANRYKDEFLGANEALGNTRVHLDEAKEAKENLEMEIQQWQDRCDDMQSRSDALKSQLSLCEQQLEEAKLSLGESEHHNGKLRSDIHEWMEKKQAVEQRLAEKVEQLEETAVHLEQTTEKLTASEATVFALQEDNDSMEATIEDVSSQLTKLEGLLQKTAFELSESRKTSSNKTDDIRELEERVKKIQKNLNIVEDELDTEREQRKEEAEDAQKALEKTREILQAKNKKEQEELQSNMASLLDDERKAYRVKDDEASRLLRSLETEWQEKHKELQDRSTSTLKHSREEAQARMDFLKREFEEELAKCKSDSNTAQNDIVRKGRKLLEEAKGKATEEIQRLDNLCQDLEKEIESLEAEKEVFRSKLGSKQQQLEFTMKQVNDRTREADEYQDQIKMLGREKRKLGEENEQYRRQLGGRYGADGKSHSQLEKLQTEYAEVVEENRNLKKNAARVELGSISEFGEGEDDGSTYKRGGGVDRRALTQVRKEYEEQLEILNDEKRDLIMKMSSQTTDVHKAEKRAWKLEEEITQLKASNTSLKLRMERMQLAHESATEDCLNENVSPFLVDSSRRSATSLSPPRDSIRPPHRSSPGIDRAKKAKEAQESVLLTRFSSLTRRQGTPPRNNMTPPHSPLVPTEYASSDHPTVGTGSANKVPLAGSPLLPTDFSPNVLSSSQNHMPSLGQPKESILKMDSPLSQNESPSIVEATQMNLDDYAKGEDQQECKQS